MYILVMCTVDSVVMGYLFPVGGGGGGNRNRQCTECYHPDK